MLSKLWCALCISGAQFCLAICVNNVFMCEKFSKHMVTYSGYNVHLQLFEMADTNLVVDMCKYNH